MFSLCNQEYVLADTPNIMLYKNYVMYDRWMSYRRFNSYFETDDAPLESEDDERRYYNRNVLNFLVLKFNRKEDGSIGHYDIVLLDANRNMLYNLGNAIYIAHVELSEYHNDFYDDMFRVARIADCCPSVCCLGINEDGKWCKNIIIYKNGYCINHHDQSKEFEDIDIDRLLTLGELMNLPEFEDIRDLPLYVNRNNEHEYNYPDHNYDDTDSSEDEYSEDETKSS